MKEERVGFQSQGFTIEGMFENAPGEKAVVVTHPHPLYGGDMHNNVVQSVVTAYRKAGYSTLRFNFRGAGGSQGTYDEGVGEQEDVKAALAYVSESGKTSIDLAGYSFGAWVNALGLNAFAQARRTVMVSPPVNFIDFSFLEFNSKVQLVIAGSTDDIAPADTIQGMINTWNPEARFHIIEGADHFYWGKTEEIEKIIYSFLEEKG
jgi:alpha/beta superfamily hydrolase